MTNAMNQTESVSKTRRIIFKITTGITIVGMLGGGASQLFQAENQVQTFEQLGYPLYLLSIIGLGKILGAITLCIPNLPPIVKISAYAGLFFVTTGAVISHIFQDQFVSAIPPFIVAAVALAACLSSPSLQFAFQRPVAD